MAATVTRSSHVNASAAVAMMPPIRSRENPSGTQLPIATVRHASVASVQSGVPGACSAFTASRCTPRGRSEPSRAGSSGAPHSVHGAGAPNAPPANG